MTVSQVLQRLGVLAVLGILCVLPGCASTSTPGPEPQAEFAPPEPETPDTPPPIDPQFALGDWTGLVQPATGSSQTVVMTLWAIEGEDVPIGRVVYANPTSTCRYFLWWNEGPAGSLTAVQRLQDGDCADGSRLVLSEAGAGHLVGDWYRADGTHWLSTRLDRPQTRYFVTVDGFRASPLQLSQKVTFSGLAVGEHELELHGVPEGCEVVGANPRKVQTEQGGTLEAVFEVLCTEATRADSTPAERAAP